MTKIINITNKKYATINGRTFVFEKKNGRHYVRVPVFGSQYLGMGKTKLSATEDAINTIRYIEDRRRNNYNGFRV